MLFIHDSFNHLEKYQKKISDFYLKIVNSFNISEIKKNEFLTKDVHPYTHFMIRKIIDDNITSKKITKMINNINSISKDHALKINNNQIVVSQKQWLVSDEETRGAELIVNKHINEKYAQKILDDHISQAADAIDSDWINFIKPIKTITYIYVPGFDSIPFFSGSNSRLFGAICLAEQSKPWITAEVITHESAHHWLFLFEDEHPNMSDGWNDKELYSPWREDPRPTMGILHGIYVFTNVCYALYKYHYNKNINDNHKNGLIERISLIASQVQCAINEIKFSKNMTQEGVAICDRSQNKIDEIVSYLPLKLLENSKQKVVETKIERVNENGKHKYIFN
tara:strand:+ start:114 stop:1127 length:1014 start_codon:yes stop_codon:yes gene_type:complete